MKTRGRNRAQGGSLVRIGGFWYVRYVERRNIGGVIERRKVSHKLGPITGKSKKAPPDIVDEARRHMATLTSSQLPSEHVLKMVEFVSQVYLPWVERYKRPSTLKGYRQAWEQHLKPHCEKINGKDTWLKQVHTFHAQQWLDAIADEDGDLSRNSLRRIQSVLSGMFSLAKRLGYYTGVNPVQDTRVDPAAAEAAETYAYTLEEIQQLLDLLPEPAATAFAGSSGCRIGEIEGLQWEDYHDGELRISRSIWNGHVGKPKTRKSGAAVPVIRQLAERLELLRVRCQNPQTGPIFANSLGKPLAMNNVLERAIKPILNRCAHCSEPKKALAHVKVPTYEGEHVYERDARLPQWHGWHAARRGLGTNLYRLGAPPMVIQRILRHSNVSTTQGYYILPVADDVRNAMKNLRVSRARIGYSKARGHLNGH